MNCDEVTDVTAISKTEHTYDEWKVTAEATCTADGTKEKVCSVCEDKVTEVIPATGHTFADEFTVDTEPSCTEEGSKSRHCVNCDEVTDVTVIPAKGHTFGEWEEVTPSTCTDTGLKQRICDICRFTESEKLDTSGHDWEEDYTVDIESTCTEDGSKSIHCKNCDSVIDSEVISATGHKGDWQIVKDSTCIESGSEELVCTVCGYKKIEEIPAKGHAWNSEPTVDKAATCTEAGSQSTHCARCGETKDAEVISALGHSWDEDYTVDKEATCTEDGSKSIHCSACDATKDTSTITAIGHEYESETSKATISANGSVVIKCLGCGDVKSSETIYYPKTIKLQATNYTYSGGVKKPSVSIIDANGNTVSSANYNVSYATGCKSVGKYKVTVTFKGDKYSGSTYTYFNINPKGTSISKVSGAKKAFTVKWKKQSSKMATSTITGYQIRYSTSFKMTSAKTKTVKGYKSTSKKITKLSAKKKYYVQVRTYKTVSGKTYYSSWSGVKSVKTK